MRNLRPRLRGRRQDVGFCDACGAVCDHASRARARRERDRDRALQALAPWR